MNGIITLFIISLVAQSNISPLGSASTSSPGFQNESSRETQFGWQLNERNELEYLIQISPDMLPFMTRNTEQQEFQCVIPRELAGRIHRVVVSIGTQVLPRTPSLQEIQQRVPTIASLPPGRIRDLESGSSVVNVQNTLPDFPTNGVDRRPNTNTRNGLDALTAPTTPLGGTFLDQAGAGNQQTSPTRNLPDPSSLPNFAQGANQHSNSNLGEPYAGGNNSEGRFADTANALANSLNNQGGNLPTSTYSQPTGTGGYAKQPNTNLQQWSPSYDPTAGTNFAQQPQRQDLQAGYDSNAYARNNARGSSQTYQDPSYARQNTQFPSTSGGFGDSFGHQGRSIADRAGADGYWNGGGYNNGQPIGRPASDMYVADNRRDTTSWDGQRSLSDGRSLPSTTVGQSNIPTRVGTDSIGTLPRTVERSDGSNNYHLFVFFVLSVAVNLWMMHLLRSLYVRYRNLLASLRGHSVASSQ